MMMSTNKMLFVVTLFLLGACSSDTFVTHTGNMPSEERIERLQKGQTKQEVINILGSPSCVASLDSNTWIYMSSAIKQVAFMQPEEIDRKLLVIKFNDQAQVVDIQHLNKNSGQEMETSVEASQNQEQAQGFFQKYFGGVGYINPFGNQAGHNNR